MRYYNKDSQTIQANSRAQSRPCNELHTANNDVRLQEMPKKGVLSYFVVINEHHEFFVKGK